jgi:hypothetical protein
MKDIDRFKEMLNSFNQPFEQGVADSRNELSDKTITIDNLFGESVVFMFDEASGRYNGFEAYE